MTTGGGVVVVGVGVGGVLLLHLLLVAVVVIVPRSAVAFSSQRLFTPYSSSSCTTTTTRTPTLIDYHSSIEKVQLRLQAINTGSSIGHGGESSSSIVVPKKKKTKNENDLLLYGQRPDKDAMISRAAVLRQSLLKQQIELQELEFAILCCSESSESGSNDDNDNQNTNYLNPFEFMSRTIYQTRNTFVNSTNVLRRKLNRVRSQVGPNNQKYNSVNDYVATQTVTGVRIISDLARNPTKLKYLVDPNTATLMPHLPAIYSRLDKLEVHVTSILEKVLNNKQHLNSIEPYLGQILERFDDIEPHFPWILKNIDILAPYTGLLLKHIDTLLLYATESDNDTSNANIDDETRYDLAEQLLPFLDFYVSRLDLVGPHLPLLRPHIPKLLKRNRIAKITPHIDRLFAKGYLNLSTSANLDVLLYWVGWTLSIPLLPRIFFTIPGSPKFVSFLANRLPRRFARKCSDVTCSIDGDYGSTWNKLSKD